MNWTISPTEYFCHPYNNARINERTIEVVLGLRYLQEHPDLFEVGATLPYYVKTKHEVIDPWDAMATQKVDAAKSNFLSKNVLSISSVEHFGLSQYGKEKVNPRKSIEFMEMLIEVSKGFLITFPTGFNKILDAWVSQSSTKMQVISYVKRSQNPIVWESVPFSTNLPMQYEYGKPFHCGNCLIVLYKETP